MMTSFQERLMLLVILTLLVFDYLQERRMKTLRSVLPKYLLLHPEFRYVPAAGQTIDHLREVFRRAREQQIEEKNRQYHSKRASHEQSASRRLQPDNESQAPIWSSAS